MEDQKFEVIQELMGKLEELMGHGPDDFSERLGRPKPEVSLEIEGEMPDGEMGSMGDDMDMEDEGPEAAFKKRLMKLRE